MTYAAEQVRRAVAALQAPPSSLEVVRKAIRSTENPNSGNLDLEQILLADPGVSARVLRMANSAYFGVSRNVSTLSVGIAIIGHERLRMLLRHVLVSEVFDTLQARREEALPIWRASVAAGAAAYVIARLARAGDPEELLTIGLLHNVGEFALLAKFPAEYLAVQRMAGGELSAAGLRTVFGVDAGEVGKWLLDAWNFPKSFGEAAAGWRGPFPHSPTGARHSNLHVIHAAATVAQAWMEGLAEEEAFGRIAPEAVVAVSLDQELLHKLYGQLACEVEQTEALLRE